MSIVYCCRGWLPHNRAAAAAAACLRACRADPLRRTSSPSPLPWAGDVNTDTHIRPLARPRSPDCEACHHAAACGCLAVPSGRPSGATSHRHRHRRRRVPPPPQAPATVCHSTHPQHVCIWHRSETPSTRPDTFTFPAATSRLPLLAEAKRHPLVAILVLSKALTSPSLPAEIMTRQVAHPRSPAALLTSLRRNLPPFHVRLLLSTPSTLRPVVVASSRRPHPPMSTWQQVSLRLRSLRRSASPQMGANDGHRRDDSRHPQRLYRLHPCLRGLDGPVCLLFPLARAA